MTPTPPLGPDLTGPILVLILLVTLAVDTARSRWPR